MAKNSWFFILSLSIALFFSGLVLGQPKKYLVYFKDKQGGNPYSVANPTQFLSAKSIQRRVHQGLSLDSTDLPVSPSYLSQVSALGATVLYPLKWLNAAIVNCEPAVLPQINALSCVQNSKVLNKKSSQSVVRNRKNSGAQNLDYGLSTGQNVMLGIDSMHAWGYHGEGMTIAVTDAGFLNVNNHVALSHLFQNQRILGTKDFVDRDGDVYLDHWHGASCLSNIGAYSPGNLVGGAFNASYYLFRTENAATEFEIECAYWVAAIEQSDSLGVDIVSVSLGYTTFDDVSMDYSYNTLNGKTAFASIAASRAASKGMVLVCAAGNEGNNNSWGGWISVPSDAEHILTVGGVDLNQVSSSFSGKGPTADGRIKPDVVAQATDAYTINPYTNNEFANYNGTSFATPLVAGLVAGFWQAHPNLTAEQVISYLRVSGTIHESPDNTLGFGVPNFIRAHITAGAKPRLSFPIDLKIYPNPLAGSLLNLELIESNALGWAEYQIIDIQGITTNKGRIYFDEVNQMKTVSLGQLPSGIYFIHMQMGGKKFIRKIAVSK